MNFSLKERLVDQVRERVIGVGGFQDPEIRELARNNDVDGVLRRAYRLHAPVAREALLHHAMEGTPSGPATDSTKAGYLITMIENERRILAALQ